MPLLWQKQTRKSEFNIYIIDMVKWTLFFAHSMNSNTQNKCEFIQMKSASDFYFRLNQLDIMFISNEQISSFYTFERINFQFSMWMFVTFIRSLINKHMSQTFGTHHFIDVRSRNIQKKIIKLFVNKHVFMHFHLEICFLMTHKFMSYKKILFVSFESFVI